jgi:1-aminocyclopropane-1-carboxylate synthase
MHIISDEIYGLSTFPLEKMISAADIMYERCSDNVNNNSNSDNDNDNDNDKKYLGDYVHIVGGLSKDWGLSGFRVGALFSHNSKINDAICNLGYFQMVSHCTQWILSSILNDDLFVDEYINDNQYKLHQCYLELVKSMKLINVNVIPAQGTLMVWCDFSQYLLPGQSEKGLWLELFYGSKILFTTGKSCYGEKPGMFRLCYAWPACVDDDYLCAMRELGQRLLKWKNNRTP